MAWGLGPGPWDAQSTPHPQVAHQLALESTSPLDVEGLVDGFVGNTHGLVIREVNLQTVGNLLRRPSIDPSAVTTMRLVAADERSLLRPGDLASLSIADPALQAVLDISAQTWIHHQLGRLGPSGHQLGLPLRNRCPILKLATASGSVAGELP